MKLFECKLRELETYLDFDFYTDEYIKNKCVEESNEVSEELQKINNAASKGKLIGKHTVNYLKEKFDIVYWKTHEYVFNNKGEDFTDTFLAIMDSEYNDVVDELSESKVKIELNHMIDCFRNKCEDMILRMSIHNLNKGSSSF